MRKSDPPTIWVIDRAAFNQGKNAQYEFQIYEAGASPTLVARGPFAVMLKEDYEPRNNSSEQDNRCSEP